MRLTRRLGRIATLILVLGALAMLATPALSAPAKEGNLLSNPGFETGTYVDENNGQETPAEWTVWWTEKDEGSNESSCQVWHKPVFQLNSGGGVPHSGVYAANAYTLWASHYAGYWQRVKNLKAGAVYRFSIYGYAISRAEADGNSTSSTKMWVGIDPNGGRDPFSGNIQWAGPYDYQDSYGVLTIDATAKDDKITVFLRSNPDWCMDHNDVFWDDASLTKIADGSADDDKEEEDKNNNDNQSQPSGDYQEATPDANGRIVHTVQSGDTLSGIAWRYGVTIAQIKQLNNLNSDVAVLGARLVIKTGDETPEPEPTEEPAEDDGSEGSGSSGDEAGDSGSEDEEVAEAPASGTGSVCITSFGDINGNGLKEPDESKVANITFALNDGSQTIATYTTDESPGYHCFENLASGDYVVSWTGDYAPTTDQNWTVNVTGGSFLQRDFGMQPPDGAGSGVVNGQQQEADTSLRDGNGMPTWLTALIGAIAVIILLTGIGAVGYFVVIRRQQKV